MTATTLDITYHVGDLLASDEPVLGHGCNIRGLMGAGIAGQIAKLYPDMFSRYQNMCLAGRFLGGESFRAVVDNGRRVVYNLATQIEPGRDGKPSLVLAAFRVTFANMEWHGEHALAIPRIGCGIAGLDWDHDVLPAIQLAGVTHLDHGGRRVPAVRVYDLPAVKP